MGTDNKYKRTAFTACIALLTDPAGRQLKQLIRPMSYFMLATLCIGAYVSPVSAEELDDLTEMSLESLMDVEVTSVSKTPQRVADTAAAIHVISNEDIRRSGATSIPEALRLAPGLQVAQNSGNAWAISARGFSNIIANKLLVMIDGRTIYNPVFSGVHWDQQDVLLADIDRIEVIRGPGGTLWGANAVNGVINIITRAAAETQGGLAEAGGGDPTGGFGALRYGGALGDSAHYRAYGKHTERSALETATGGDADDDGEQSQVGGRIDWQLSARDNVTLQGDAYTGDFGQRLFSPSLTPPGMFNVSDSGDKHGQNLLVRWQRLLDTGSDFTLQAYYDHYERDSLISGESVRTWDIDFQHQKNLHEDLNVIWGLGYRHQDVELEDRFNIQFGDTERGLDTFSAFLQGDYDITKDLQLTLGSKFEHNEFTGFEYQPSIRMHWHPDQNQNHTLWGAVSRAVRTPNLVDDDASNNFFVFTQPFGPPLLFQSVGNPELDSEELLAYEIGYRGRLRPDLALDIAAFYNDYDKLLSTEFNPVPEFRTDPVPHLLFQSFPDNQLRGATYGLEASTEWQATDRWRLTASYTLLKMDLRPRSGSTDLFTADFVEDSNPEQQFQIRSYLDLPHNLEFDTALYWVDRLPGNPELFTETIDDYLRLDLHLGWKPTPDLQLGLFAQNLLDNRHRETDQFVFVPSEIPRAVFARMRLTWE